jgi:hypothetical protein
MIQQLQAADFPAAQHAGQLMGGKKGDVGQASSPCCSARRSASLGNLSRLSMTGQAAPP